MNSNPDLPASIEQVEAVRIGFDSVCQQIEVKGELSFKSRGLYFYSRGLYFYSDHQTGEIEVRTPDRFVSHAITIAQDRNTKRVSRVTVSDFRDGDEDLSIREDRIFYFSSDDKRSGRHGLVASVADPGHFKTRRELLGYSWRTITLMDLDVLRIYLTELQSRTKNTFLDRARGVAGLILAKISLDNSLDAELRTLLDNDQTR